MSGQPFRARFGFDADAQKLFNLADPTQPTDGVNLRTLELLAGMHIVARVGNLPSPSDPDQTKHPKNGTSYLVKFDLDGNPMDRIAVWDDNQKPTGGVAAVDVIEPAADAAAITAAAGTSDPGNPFTAGAGTNAVLDLLANADGSITATVTAPGDGYAIGDSMTVPATSLAWSGMTGDTIITVTALTGTSPTGGWRFVDPQIWVKALRADANPAPGARPGDLTATTEKDHEELKIWDGTTWHDLVSTDKIKAWIAALNLFQGTVQEEAGTEIGTIKISGLPDITVSATGAAHSSQYWVWTGAAGYTVQPADPKGLGTDLPGVVLQVGDWLQVAAQAGSNPGDPTTYHWSHIGGDLLARSRADSLYGLAGWVAGNYEKGSLVNYNGDIYRADRAVLPADTAPGTKASAGPPVITAAPWTKVPLSGGVKSVPTDADLPATAPSTEVYLVLSSAKAGAKPALYSYDAGSTQWLELGGGSATPLTLGKGDQLIGVGCPIGTVVTWVLPNLPAGWLLCDGGVVDVALYPELAALLPGGTMPDLRGAFLRGAGAGANGWGDAARVVGSRENDSTALPDNAFSTSTGGSHYHIHNRVEYPEPNTTWDTNAYIKTGTTGWVGANTFGFAQAKMKTQGAGTHAHSIVGGDAETRPVNYAVNYIMKATDRTVQRHAVTWPTTP
jgi:hypothetical protein